MKLFDLNFYDMTPENRTLYDVYIFFLKKIRIYDIDFYDIQYQDLSLYDMKLHEMTLYEI